MVELLRSILKIEHEKQIEIWKTVPREPHSSSSYQYRVEHVFPLQNHGGSPSESMDYVPIWYCTTVVVLELNEGVAVE
jgi:hypothetical protein